MNDTDKGLWYVYHLRDAEKSAGFGHDGYLGITRNPARRKQQHMAALAAGRHRNLKLQTEHEASAGGLQFWIVSSGTREQVLARERLLVPKADHHLNRQIGGGPLRGLSNEKASAAAFSTYRPESDTSKAKAEHPQSKSSRRTKGSSGAGRTGTGTGTGAGAGTGTGAGGARAFAGAGGAAVAVGASLLTVGLGSAYVMNKTVLKDEVGLSNQERSSRSNGRVASYTGGVLGAASTLTAIGASGTVVGLSGSGIAAGVTAIGTSVGGGALVGTVLVAALPAAAACGLGYGVYRFSKWLRS